MHFKDDDDVDVTILKVVFFIETGPNMTSFHMHYFQLSLCCIVLPHQVLPLDHFKYFKDDAIQTSISSWTLNCKSSLFFLTNLLI